MQSSSRNGAKVIWLAVHTTEGIMRAVDLRAWTTWPGSSHAANDETGVLLSGAADGFVDYSRAAWTLRSANPISDNLEQCGWARWPRAEWLARPKLLDTTARWLAERHVAQPWIPLVHLSLADIRARKPGVIGHGDYTYATGDGTHTDPGPNYPWDVVIDKARAYAANLQEDDVNEQDIAEIVHRVLDTDVGGGSLADFIRANVGIRDDKGKPLPINGQVLDVALDSSGATLAKFVRGGQPVAGGANLDAAKLLADVGAVVRDALAKDNAAQADEIVDRLAARLGTPAA